MICTCAMDARCQNEHKNQLMLTLLYTGELDTKSCFHHYWYSHTAYDVQTDIFENVSNTEVELCVIPSLIHTFLHVCMGLKFNKLKANKTSLLTPQRVWPSRPPCSKILGLFQRISNLYFMTGFSSWDSFLEVYFSTLKRGSSRKMKVEILLTIPVPGFESSMWASQLPPHIDLRLRANLGLVQSQTLYPTTAILLPLLPKA